MCSDIRFISYIDAQNVLKAFRGDRNRERCVNF